MATLILFTAVMGLADAWLVGWLVGSMWGAAVAAGTIIGLMLATAWTIRRPLPSAAAGVAVVAAALAGLLSRSSLGAGFFSVLVAAGIWGGWFLAHDVWPRRAHR